MTLNKILYYILAAIGVLLVLYIVVWFFTRSSTPAITTSGTPTATLPSTGSTNTSPATTPTGGTTNIEQTNATPSAQKIFAVTAGPVAGATVIQTLHPTTTLARYINQNDGHVYDLPLDVPGALPRVVSNVTIPGGQRVVWVSGGAGALMQYLSGSTVKTVYLGFPAANASSTVPTKIQYLPDNIADLAASPDGKSVAYLLHTASGADGYLAHADGTGAARLFSLPLSELLVSWPSQTTLLIATKSATGVPGMTFGIDTKTGSVTPLVAADGLTAIADASFTNLIYQTTETAASTQATYVHNIKNGTDMRLSLDPFTEQCIFSHIAANLLFCAVPEANVVANFLDLWHQGRSGVSDGIFAYTTTQQNPALIVTPGYKDGGSAADILELSLSPDEHYLLYLTKGDRSLWGVRLTQ